MSNVNELRIPAIECRQGNRRSIYSFAVDGKLIPSFASVAPARRDENNHKQGHQRPEVYSLIGEIRNYIESEFPMLPNSVVVAFDSRVRFEASEHDKNDFGYARVGTLRIPIDPTGTAAEKPGVIIDGRQRVAAIREAEIRSFPVVVTAFVSSDIREQSEQFILINSTKPLPKELVYELLPDITATLPKTLQRRRFPSYLLGLLNHSEDSPFRGLIRTATTPHGLVKDSAVLTMLENSLSDGALYRFRYIENEIGDVDSMLAVVSNFWRAVSHVFVEAWALPIRRSRLMHGVGIISLGFLMDAIADRFRHAQVPTQEQFADDLKPLASVCRWADGYWDFGPGAQRKWNEIQSTPKDIRLLTNYLLVQYKSLVFNHASRI